MAHLDLLIAQDPDMFYFVVLDNASAHVAQALSPFWERYQQQIEPVFLPTYSPHLNLIERLWRLMRGQITRNQFYESIDDLCQDVCQWFETVPFEQFCSILGIDEKQILLCLTQLFIIT